MQSTKISLIVFFLVASFSGFSQEETDEYLEFNDRKNVVHGVYLGLSTRLGEIDGNSTYVGELKVAYVANQQFEVGFAGNFLYSEQDIYNDQRGRYEDIIVAYGGLHLEPIFFSKNLVNLSFPLLIGAGGVGYVENNFRDDDYLEEDLTGDDINAVFVAEPGVSALFNISRYLQIEAGVKYRFSSRINLPPTRTVNINGFSAGIGIKVGVFNMGRNRYKKNVQ